MLGSAGEELTDEQVCQLSDGLYSLAEMAVDLYSLPGRQRPAGQYGASRHFLGAEEREVTDERAAICEYEGRLPRDAAERLAVVQTLNSRLRH